MMKSILALVIVLATTVGRGAAGTNCVQRTVVLIQKQVSFGQFVFLRGGIHHSRREGCPDDNADTSPCAIPIQHNQITDTNNTHYNDWSTHDDYLDWHGRESDQSSSGGNEPYGTPLVWTTNDVTYDATVAEDGYGYTPLNTFGEHYWMMDVEMDCSKTDGGWFEFKGFGPGSGDWEPNVNQDDTCSGDANASKLYDSDNHFAKCGHLNTFVFNHNECQIDTLE